MGRQPRCIIIAGPNGAGKTTLAKSYLLQFAGIENFINADYIASGLLPLKPERASRAAGRVYDASGEAPILLSEKGMRSRKKPSEQARLVTLALKRAAKEARRIAKMHGTKVWVMRDGKLVGIKP